jgi:adenosylhomocysteine nucleosidase
MIGILCATPEELEAVRARLGLDGRPAVHGPTRVWEGRGLTLAQSGIGKVNAAAAATLLAARFGAHALVFSGVAGALDPALEVGSVLLADALAIHDYGYVTGGRFTPTASGLIPIGAPRLSAPVPVSAEVVRTLDRLRAAVQPKLARCVRRGSIVTADYFLNCGETRERLRAELGADAIDMESGAVAQVAAGWGVPLYVIRTVSDLAGEDSHVAYPEMARMAAETSAVCVPELIALLADENP